MNSKNFAIWFALLLLSAFAISLHVNAVIMEDKGATGFVYKNYAGGTPVLTIGPSVVTAAALNANGYTLVLGSGTITSGQTSGTLAVTGATAGSLAFANLMTAQTTAAIKSAVPGSGTVTVVLTAAASADTSVSVQIWK